MHNEPRTHDEIRSRYEATSIPWWWSWIAGFVFTAALSVVINVLIAYVLLILSVHPIIVVSLTTIIWIGITALILFLGWEQVPIAHVGVLTVGGKRYGAKWFHERKWSLAGEGHWWVIPFLIDLIIISTEEQGGDITQEYIVTNRAGVPAQSVQGRRIGGTTFEVCVSIQTLVFNPFKLLSTSDKTVADELDDTTTSVIRSHATQCTPDDFPDAGEDMENDILAELSKRDQVNRWGTVVVGANIKTIKMTSKKIRDAYEGVLREEYEAEAERVQLKVTREQIAQYKCDGLSPSEAASITVAQQGNGIQNSHFIHGGSATGDVSQAAMIISAAMQRQNNASLATEEETQPAETEPQQEQEGEN